MFCPNCDSLMFPKEGKLVCNKCDVSSELEKREAIKREKKTKSKPVVMDNSGDARPVVKMACQKCSNTKALAELRQVRAADEPETQFYTCTECGHRWRVN